MVFSSSIFLFLFLPLTLLVYYLLKESYRNMFLLLASFAFYAWAGPKYLIILLLSTLINYLVALLLSRMKNSREWPRRMMLLAGVAANLGMLFYFKYFNFFITTVNSIGRTKMSLSNIALPLGISFFTFCGLSYIIDVYKEKVEAHKNLLNVALYLSFFPKLAQGPISRYGDMAGQIEKRTCTVEKFNEGIWRFTIGLAKKMIIANQLGIMVDKIYANPADQNTAAIAWIGSIGYTLQIYFDFSGYSDMAIGLGKMFGFDIMENFNYPYISKTMTEFWRRWHISLSSWFRDYVYIPLGGSRTGNVYVNLFIVFVVTGLWHGAAWNFIVWGIFHGVFILIDHFMKNKKIEMKLPEFVRCIITMFIVNIGWVLFRAPSLSYAIKFIGVMFGIRSATIAVIPQAFFFYENMVTLLLAIVFCFPIFKTIQKIVKSYVLPNKIARLITPFVYVLLFVISISYMVNGSYNPFLYMNF